MIKNYALEETTPEGKPTGKFYFKILNAQVAAYEILQTHMGLTGKKA